MGDYETTQRRRNIVVGLFVIAAMCALGWLIYMFGDLPIKVSEMRSFKVYVQFPRAPGIQKNTPVQFCGYQVGRVTDVEPPKILKDLKTGQFYHQTMIVLSVDRKYDNIPSNVDVKMMTRGLGSSYIELIVEPALQPVPLDPNRPETCWLPVEVPLQGSTGMTSEFFPAESQKKLDELIDSLRILLGNANDIIGDPNNKENLKITLVNLSEASKHVTQTLKDVQEFAVTGTKILKDSNDKIERVVSAVVGTSEELNRTLKEFSTAGTATLKIVDEGMEKVAAAVVGTSEELNETMKQLRLILVKVNNGQGTAGKFINDGKLYENLLEDTQRLEELLEELKSVIDKVNEKGLRSIW